MGELALLRGPEGTQATLVFVDDQGQAHPVENVLNFGVSVTHDTVEVTQFGDTSKKYLPSGPPTTDLEIRLGKAIGYFNGPGRMRIEEATLVSLTHEEFNQLESLIATNGGTTERNFDQAAVTVIGEKAVLVVQEFLKGRVSAPPKKKRKVARRKSEVGLSSPPKEVSLSD